MAGITRRLELRIAGESSSLSAPLNLYRGDRGIDIYFRVMDFSYDFTGTNLLRNIGSARYNAIVVKPDGSNYVTPTQPIVDNEVKFTITKDLTDEMTEIGTYTLQFLFHGVGDSRVAIPPITIEVKELIADVADGADGQANYSTTNKTTIKAGQATIEARWEIGELITADKLNWTRDKAIQGAETSQANSNKISVLEPKVTALEEKVTPLQTDVQTLREKVDDFQNINIMNQEVNGVESITINNTYDGVTKDLVIKGETLQNLYNPEHCKGGTLDEESFRKFTLTTSSGWHAVGYQSEHAKFIPFYKENTTYTIIAEIAENTLSGTGELFRINEPAPERIFTTSVKLPNNFTGVFVAKVRTKSDFSSITNGIYPCLTSYCTSGTIKIRFMILEGDYTQNAPSTYFDSITSSGELEDNKILIKSVGKNLCDNNKNRKIEISSDTGIETFTNNHICSDYIKIDKILNFTASTLKNQQVTFRWYDSNKKYIKSGTERPSNSVYVRLRMYNSNGINVGDDFFQLESGSVATNYEPYVENIKEIKIPFENGLKSLPNSVCDEIKEKEIIQRVGRVVLNGSENWNISVKTSATNTSCFQFMLEALGGEGLESVCDKLPYIDGLWEDEPQYDKRGYDIASNGNLIVRELKSNLSTQDVVGFKAWLKENPVTVYYELAQPIIQPLHEDYSLRTYQGVTHLYQENNICGEMDVSVPSNRDGIIHSNTMEIIELNDKLEQTFDYLDGKIPVYVPESFEGDTTIKDSMIGETQQLSVKGKTILLEGDYINNPPNEYFDSITSTGEQEDNKIKIKSVGKNLYPYETLSETKKEIMLPIGDYVLSLKGNSVDSRRVGVYIKDSNNNTLASTAIINNGITICKFKVATSGLIRFYIADWESGSVLREPATNVMVEQNTVATNYEPYIEHYKEITLPFEGGLKSLPNGVKDEIKGEKAIQRIGKASVLSGMKLSEVTSGDKYGIVITIDNKIDWFDNISFINNKFIQNKSNSNKTIYQNPDNFVVIFDNPITVEEFKTQYSDFEIYFGLKNPILHDIELLQLQTYDEITHITQENNIVTNIEMLTPISLNKTIGRVQDENVSLTKENRILKEDNKIVAEALLNIMQPINTLDEKGKEYKPHTQEEIINRLIEILSR